MHSGFEHESRVGMPLRYFIELLNQEKRLVFTGKIHVHITLS